MARLCKDEILLKYLDPALVLYFYVNATCNTISKIIVVTDLGNSENYPFASEPHKYWKSSQRINILVTSEE